MEGESICLLIDQSMIRFAIPVLHVSDSDSAERFYCDRLGFSKNFDYRPFGTRGPRYMGLVKDGARLHLSSFSGDGIAGNAVVIVVTNVDALYEEYRNKGVKIDLPPTDQSWGNREMYIHDADQNSLRFTQWEADE